MKRFDFTDIARGLAILYIIQCHVCDYHIAWIDSWAMPVFFVIMGIFFKPTSTWREMIVKKAKTILLPFLLLSIPSFIQYAIQLSFTDFLKRIVDPFNCMHGVGWFLVCMFWCYLIYYAIHRVVKGKMYMKLILSLLVSILFYYLSTWRPEILGGHRLVFPLFISTSFTCMSLIAIGELLRDYLLRNAALSCNMLIISVLLGGGIILLFGCKGGAMIVNDYYGQPYILWIVNSILGSMAILEISKYLPSFMSFFGRHSLLMLMVHPYVKRILLIQLELSIITYVAIVIITTILVYALAKYLPITEGKIKFKSNGINKKRYKIPTP